MLDMLRQMKFIWAIPLSLAATLAVCVLIHDQWPAAIWAAGLFVWAYNN